MNELALFAGAGGGILGGTILGWRTVCAVELDSYARRVLLARQRDGCLPRFPIWDDVRTFDGKPWRGHVDVISGGFPCQDISCAGKGSGIDGARSGLWSEFARIIREVGPNFVFVENSPMLTSRGLGRVLGDLAELGYDAKWGVLGAVHAGAPHKRLRIWIVAHAQKLQCDGGNNNSRQRAQSFALSKSGNGGGKTTLADTNRSLCTGRSDESRREAQRGTAVGGSGQDVADAASGGQPMRRWAPGQGRHAVRDDLQTEESADPIRERLERIEQAGAATGTTDGPDDGRDRSWWAIEPELGRVAHGVAHRVDRLKAIGNGQVPAVAAMAWSILSKDL